MIDWRLLGEVTLAFLVVISWGVIATGLVCGAYLLIGWPAAVAMFVLVEIGTAYPIAKRVYG